MKQAFFICALLIGFTSGVLAQHVPLFSQYFFNPQGINPANAGFNDVLDASIIHRRQWVSFEGAPLTTQLNLHTALYDKRMSLGTNIENDRIGVTNRTMVNFIYAYRLFFKPEKYLSFGISTGLGQLRNDWDKIKTTVSGDPVYNTGNESRLFFRGGAGMVYTSPKLHLGFSSPTLFQTRPFSENNAQQFLFHGKYTQAINEVAEILPSALIRIQKNSPVQADINTVFRFYELYSFGIGYRLNDAFIFTTAVKFSNQFEMGYAYDFTLSPIQSYSNGSHEIMLRYVFAYPVTAVRPRY